MIRPKLYSVENQWNIPLHYTKHRSQLLFKGLSPVTWNLCCQSAQGNRSGAVRYFPEAVRPLSGRTCCVGSLLCRIPQELAKTVWITTATCHTYGNAETHHRKWTLIGQLYVNMEVCLQFCYFCRKNLLRTRNIVMLILLQQFRCQITVDCAPVTLRICCHSGYWGTVHWFQCIWNSQARIFLNHCWYVVLSKTVIKFSVMIKLSEHWKCHHNFT